MENAHDSLMDAKAQTDVVLHPYFKGYWNKKYSISTVADMWKHKTIRKANQKDEVNWPVPNNWKSGNEATTWEPAYINSYEGPCGGAELYGPSNSMKEVCRTTSHLSGIFFKLFPLSLFGYIARMSQIYAHEDWVVPVDVVDRDGNIGKKQRWKPCKRGDEGSRHRAKSDKFKFTPGFVICWVGILIYYGSVGTKKSPLNFWVGMPYGIYAPWIQNVMTQDAFKFCRRFLHLSRTITPNHRVNSGYDPLSKVRYVMKTIMAALRSGWIAGKRVTIDESMIKYCGRAISFIQYMPKKPIKHGIKVFALCCGYTGYLLGYEVYLGKDTETTENSALAVVDRLLINADLVTAKGRILYTDNWYTTLRLAKFLYVKYGWLFVGTVVPSDSKVRNENSIPFRRLTSGALDKIERGWMRKATMMVTGQGKNRTHHIQCTTWKDKKQVTFVHTHLVKPSEETTVKRHVKNKRKRVDIKAPTIQQDYATYFNDVDVNDHDSADYSVSIRTNRWYFRVFLWLADRVIFSCYLIITQSGKEEWAKYRSKHDGRRKFQIDLALSVLEYGIKLEWKEPYNKEEKPKWLRQQNYIPCGCKKCFFCMNGMTSGIDHSPTSRKEKKRKRDEKVCSIERVDLGRGGSYCRPCYRKQSNMSETHTQKRKGCASTRLGCKGCEEFVCAQCWKSYEHKS